MAADSDGGADSAKAIHQRHLVEGMRDVLASKRVMQQSLTRMSHALPSADMPEDLLQRLEARLGRHALNPLIVSATALAVATAALVLALLR